MLGPPITTTRLLLKPWEAGDAPQLRAALDANDAHLRPWIPFMREEPRSLEGTEAWIEDLRRHHRQGSAYRFGIWDQRAPATTLAGEVMLIDRGLTDSLELGYWLTTQACGQGLAMEACRGLLDAAWQVPNLQTIEIHCDEDNTASIRVAERLGASWVACQRIEEVGRTVTLRIHELLRPRPSGPSQ